MSVHGNMMLLDGRYIRKDYAAILCSSAGVFPRLSPQLEVYCAANAIVNDALRIDPRVHDEAGAGLEVI